MKMLQAAAMFLSLCPAAAAAGQQEPLRHVVPESDHGWAKLARSDDWPEREGVYITGATIEEVDESEEFGVLCLVIESAVGRRGERVIAGDQATRRLQNGGPLRGPSSRLALRRPSPRRRPRLSPP